MLKKIKDLVIYQEADYYAAFPAVAALGGGRLLVVFRRAPNYSRWPGFGESFYTHLDLNAQLMMTHSEDNGDTWSAPSLLYAPPAGCSQDGGLYYDGRIVFANSFIWGYLPLRTINALRESGQDEFVYGLQKGEAPDPQRIASHVGSYSMRSLDQGRSWERPVFPAPLPGNLEALPGQPLRMHNRANILRVADGRLLFPGQALRYRPAYHSAVVLYVSQDDGRSWQYLSTPAGHSGKAVFEEPCLYETASGKLVILIRCHGSPAGEKYRRALLWKTESHDGGATWSQPENLGFHAEPCTAQRLSDGRVMVAYGYRQDPQGVRVRICDSELTDLASSQEVIIRDDAGVPDTGYPWIAPLGGSRYLIVYYMNRPEARGASMIAASVVEVLD